MVQQAMVWVLESIYEEEFLGFGYGFRPGRSPHRALGVLYLVLTVKKTSFVLDAEIQTLFDNVENEHLMRFLENRIGDRRVLKLIKQTLEAGIVDDGVWQETNQGVAQGTVISPLLANIYLHYCLDQWAHQWRGRHIEEASTSSAPRTMWFAVSNIEVILFVLKRNRCNTGQDFIASILYRPYDKRESKTPSRR